MELKPGYKQTEVGVIPEDWGVAPIGQAFDICNNLRLPISQTVREKMAGPFPYYGPTGIQGYINEYRVEGEYALIGEDGDHFLKWRDQSMTLLVSGKFNVNNHAHLIGGTKNLAAWFYYYFSHRDLTPYLTRQGAGRYKLTKNVLIGIPCALPAPPEQEAIAEALSDADALIESLEQLIAKKRQIKQGAMQELLTGKKRLPGFAAKPGYKQTEVGVIPEEWEVRPLVDIAEIRSGIAKNSNIAVSNPVLVHYLRVANVQDGFLNLSEMSKIRMNINDIERYSVLPGDVLMNEGGDLDKLGRGSMWRGEFSPCVHQNHVFVVRCGSRLSPDYLNVWTGAMPARRYFMLAGKQTTNLASINKTALGQLPVALPPRAEQEALATVLSDMDAEIAALEEKLAKARQLKQGMMQELLTGKTRLVEREQ